MGDGFVHNSGWKKFHIKRFHDLMQLEGIKTCTTHKHEARPSKDQNVSIQ